MADQMNIVPKASMGDINIVTRQWNNQSWETLEGWLNRSPTAEGIKKPNQDHEHRPPGAMACPHEGTVVAE